MPALAEPFFSKPLIGILSAVIGNIIISIALNVQRYAHLRLESLLPVGGSESERSYFRSSWWWLGVLLMTAGETGNFVAYGFAPASVVSPLGVLTLVSNCVIAPTFFGERISQRNILGVTVTVVGTLLIIKSVPSGAAQTPSTIASYIHIFGDSPHDFLIITLSRLSFRIYIIVVTVLILFLLALRQKTSATARGSSTYLFSNIGLVALVGAFTALSTKGLSGLLNYSFSQAIADPLTYILLLVLVVTAIVQVLFLNAALKVFDATTVLPVHFVLFTISVIVGSAVAFQDFENSDASHLALFVIGCLFTFAGVWLITSTPGGDSSVRDLIVAPKTTPALVTLDSNEATTSESQPLLFDQSEHKHKISRNSTITVPFSIRPALTKSYSYTNGSAGGGALLPVVSHNEETYRTSASVPQQCLLLDRDQLDHYKTTFTSSGFFIGTVLQTKRSLNFIYNNNNSHSSNSQDWPSSQPISEV